MYAPRLNGDWQHVSPKVRTQWPRLSAEDVISIDGERDLLVRALRERYGKSYGELESTSGTSGPRTWPAPPWGSRTT